LAWGAGGVSTGFHDHMYDKELSRVVSQIITEDELASAFTAPKYEFVTKDAWVDDTDGKYDVSKVVFEQVFGKAREGIWVLRGREGVFGWKATAKKSSTKRTIEDDGSGPFAEQRSEKIMNALHSGVDAAEKKRRENCVVAPAPPKASDILQMLQTHSLAASPGLGPCEQETPGSASGLATKDEEEDDDEEEDEHKSGKKRLSMFMGPAVPTKSQRTQPPGQGSANPATRPASKANFVVTRVTRPWSLSIYILIQPYTHKLQQSNVTSNNIQMCTRTTSSFFTH